MFFVKNEIIVKNELLGLCLRNAAFISQYFHLYPMFLEKRNLASQVSVENDRRKKPSKSSRPMRELSRTNQRAFSRLR